MRDSGRYPLTATGDINTYAIFAETFFKLIGAKGRPASCLPPGIATDNHNQTVFRSYRHRRAVGSLFSFFENQEFIFLGVDQHSFCLIDACAVRHRRTRDFVFSANASADLADQRRHFSLSADDIALINPNTRTCPIFRTVYDAELTKKIYVAYPC